MRRINVTECFLPPMETYTKLLEQIWESKWVTNRGPLVRELETKIQQTLQTNDLIFTTNGTLPIQIAIRLLADGGEVITTPFSYVATSAAIVWEKCVPVFVDIERDFLTIDPTKIEAKITAKTKAILATHVFGNPCDVEAIEVIAKKHGLKVIYDAAHSFDVEYLGQSIFNFGDVSTCSFHATKLFHTGEGGAVFCRDKDLFEKLLYSHNFGHNGPEDFFGLGINGKPSELQAAMGLAVFPFRAEIKAKRKAVVDQYLSLLDGKALQFMNIRPGTVWNYSYFPVIFESTETLLKVQRDLNSRNIFPRRYFYPSLNTIDYLKGESCPVSESISQRILCQPLMTSLTENEVQLIAEIVNSSSHT